MSNLVTGSLGAIAKESGKSLAESFMSADAIVLVDVSGSMSDTIRAPGGGYHSRYQAACLELEKLQRTLPGRIAVVEFSSGPAFCWSGRPSFQMGGTDMAEALRFIKPADGCGMTIVLISDGMPDDAGETLSVARGFTTKIDTIFIGNEGEEGAAFLRRLAAATGGSASVNTVPELAAAIKGLLPGKAAA